MTMGSYGNDVRANWTNRNSERFDKYGTNGLGGGLPYIDWTIAKPPPFERNFYEEDKRISALTDREVEDFRRSKEIKVSFMLL